MSTEYNYKHINVICPECKSSNILFDQFHQETYCTKCGLVLQYPIIFQVTKAIEEDNIKVKFIRDLWRKKL